MKRFLILLVQALLVAAVCAETKMIIHQRHGGNVEVMLKDKPVATYEEKNLVVDTDVATMRFELREIEKVTFEDVATRIDAVSVRSHEDGTSRVYTLGGVLVKEVNEGKEIDLSQLAKGTYVIKNNKHSYKIIKR